MSAMRAPARYASATPSPVATSGFVVSANTWPAPPVASSVARAERATRLAARVDEAHAETSAVFDDGAHRERVLQHADARDGGDALPEHATDLAPRGIRRMQHAADAVRAFGRERRLAVGVAIEARAPLDRARACSAAPRRRGRERRARRRGRRPRSSCRRRAVRANRLCRSPRRCRLARTRCCFRSDRLS